MWLPLSKPGGAFVANRNALNEMQNNRLLKEMNEIRKQYLPITTQAEAASKLAYANLMGPQFLAKIMGNDSALANMTEDQKMAALDMVRRAGMGQGTGANAFNQMQQGNGAFAGIGQPSTNAISEMGNAFNNSPAGQLWNGLKNILGKHGTSLSPNPMAQENMPQPSTPQPQSPFAKQSAMGGQSDAPSAPPVTPLSQKEIYARRPKDGVSVVGEQWYDKDGNPVYEETPERAASAPSYEENTGSFKGTVKEGEELGKLRANMINDIGVQQMALSTSGANLDRIIEDINDPEFMALRKDFPFYQDMQLTALSKIGSPEQQEMIGNFIADVKSFAGATVNQFKGATMKREFDYADQLKPNENDTVNSARGKLTALKSLKEIAERKNNIILDLMQNKHMNIGDAVKIANKQVDVKAIGEEVKKLTSPMISVRNPKTGITIRLPLLEARKRGVKNV